MDKTVFTNTYWPVADVDLSLLISGGIAIWAAHKLALRERGGVQKQTIRPAKEVAHV